MSQSRLTPTAILSDRYRLLELIGEGGSAQVFRAIDERLDRLVAVKVLRPQFSDDAGMRARFGVEARAAAALSAPNIVPVYDFGTSVDGSLFIVMALVEGRSLRELLRERGALTQREAARIGYGVALALSVAHGRGLVHRDVKPGNILLDADGVPRLTDFGIVKALSGATEITQPGVAFGTAAYLSPEQATGGRVGPAADLYSLGTVLYEMITGSPPFPGPDAEQVRYQQASELPRPPSVLLPAVDTRLEALIMACLAKDPDGRPESAAQVAATLATILERLPAQSATGVAAPAQVAENGLAAVALEGPSWDGASADAVPRGAIALPSISTTDFEPEPVDLDRTQAYRPGVVLGPRAGPRVALTGGRRDAGAGPVPTRSSASIVLGLLLLIAAVVVVGAWFLADPGGPDRGGVAIGPTSAPASSAPPLPAALGPSDSASATATPGPTAAPTVEDTQVPTSTSTLLPGSLPTLRNTPTPRPTTGPTREPTPRPTPGPTPTPTPAPTATPSPSEPPTRRSTAVRGFRGGFNGRYHDRSAAWVYGQGTEFDTMVAGFSIEGAGSVRGEATLRFIGIDAEDPAKKPIRIVINGTVIYEGPDTLPNDFCCGPGGAGNWRSAEFDFPGSLLRSSNLVAITNLTTSDCTYCPNFVMVDSAAVSYIAREGS